MNRKQTILSRSSLMQQYCLYLCLSLCFLLPPTPCTAFGELRKEGISFVLFGIEVDCTLCCHTELESALAFLLSSLSFLFFLFFSPNNFSKYLAISLVGALLGFTTTAILSMSLSFGLNDNKYQKLIWN